MKHIEINEKGEFVALHDSESRSAYASARSQIQHQRLPQAFAQVVIVARFYQDSSSTNPNAIPLSWALLLFWSSRSHEKVLDFNFTRYHLCCHLGLCSSQGKHITTNRLRACSGIHRFSLQGMLDARTEPVYFVTYLVDAAPGIERYRLLQATGDELNPQKWASRPRRGLLARNNFG